CVSHGGEVEMSDTHGRVRQRYKVQYGSHVFVADGATVESDQPLFEWDPYNNGVVTERPGVGRFVGGEGKRTGRGEVGDTTGHKLLVIMEDRSKELQPAIDIVSASGQKLAHYPLPTGARLEVRDGQSVGTGDVLVKTRREGGSKTRDITGGLPRVAELFE